MRRDGPSDKTILRRARQGDRRSFLILLHRYDPRLRRLAFRLLADPNRLERVLSRAYLKAWRSLPFLKRTEPAAGWLYRVVYNTCINEMRWEPSRTAPAPPDDDQIPLPAASPERRLLALRALRPGERIPLVLVDGEGMSLDAAARMMRHDPAEVASDLTAARGRWRAFVSGGPEPLPEPAAPEPVDERGLPDAEPSLAPSPAATLAKLAALAAPTAPREPVGHVRLLAPGPGGSAPPSVAAKPPAARRSDLDQRGRRSVSGVPGPGPVRPLDAPPVPEPAAADPAHSAEAEAPAVGVAGSKPEVALPSGAGAGARRKRRRDAKRAVRSRGRGSTTSGAAKPTGDGRGGRDDRDPA